MSGLKLYLPDQRRGVMPIAYVHALAQMGVDGLVLIEPEDPFVSVGYFDDTDQVVDRQRCGALGVPVVRRWIGGGPVLLGPGQVFYQLVLSRGSPLVPPRIDDAYRILSAPVVDAYMRLGVDVRYRPINDLVAMDGRKISGQGAADIEGSFCFVGAVLRHFDTALMAELLRVPDEKLRGRLHETLQDNVTSIVDQTGVEPSTEEVIKVLSTCFSSLLGPLIATPLPDEVGDLAVSLCKTLTSPEELGRRTGRRHRAIKLREGVETRFGVHKAPGGLIRADVDVRDGFIESATLFGDFTFLPGDRFAGLCEAVSGIAFDTSEVCLAVRRYMQAYSVQCPGVTPEDFAIAICGESAN